ncbi:hypothetical protein Ancab_010880 [Ancistrocladus abbreviatus]
MLSLSRARLKKLVSGLWLVLLLKFCFLAESSCGSGCDLALASYYFWDGTNLSFISMVLSASIEDILGYNTQIASKDFVISGTRINVPFSCGCLNNTVLGHAFNYTLQQGDTYDTLAGTYFSNLTTVAWIEKFNSYNPNNLQIGDSVTVVVNCTCGNSSVSKEYGLFITYPLRPGDTINYVADYANRSVKLLREYNPDANFSAGAGLVYFPGRDKSGNFRPLQSSKGASSGVIVGISVAVAAVLVILVVYIYFRCIRRRKMEKASLLPEVAADPLTRPALESFHGTSGGSTGGAAGVPGMTVDKSVEFSYEELAKATNDFSLANKIGQGGFGAVYYAELRGEVCYGHFNLLRAYSFVLITKKVKLPAIILIVHLRSQNSEGSF